MDWWLVTFLLGAILSLFLPIVPDIFYVVFFICMAAMLIFFKRSRSSSGLMFGAAWLIFYAAQYNNVWKANEISIDSRVNKPWVIQGKVITLPRVDRIVTAKDANRARQKKATLRFNFTVTHIEQRKLPHPFNIKLRWDKAPEEVYSGERWQFIVKVKPAHGFANKGGFSYQTWLRQNQLVATGYVLNKRINKKVNSKLSEGINLRQRLHTQATSILPSDLLSPLLLALSFGDRSEISQDLWRVLQATGTQHLIAISGLHLGLVASGTFFVVLLLMRVFPIELVLKRLAKISILSPVAFAFNRKLLLHNTRLAAMVISCLLTCYYAYLAGFSLPTIRALVMVLLYWGARLLGIKLSLRRWLLITLFIIILLAPFSLFSGSFWLSFYAVSLIFTLVWRFTHQLSSESKFASWLKALLMIQVSLSVFMLPISALFNHQISVVAIMANLIAVPLMSFTSIPLCLLAVLVLPFSSNGADFLFNIGLQSLALTWQWLEYLSQLSWAVSSVSSDEIMGISLGVALVTLGYLLALNRRWLVAIMSVLLISGFTYKSYYRHHNNWTVNIMDVGQGLSIIIERNQGAIIYDTGASYPTGFNLVDSVISPYLQHQGIKIIDKVIISHSDNDHAGGLNKLREQVDIREVIANNPKLTGDSLCKQGKSFVWQSLTFTMLWPNSEQGAKNDDSCVIRINDGKNSVLLTGDISHKVEREL